MPVLYDQHWTKPRALVERRLRLEVTEKLRPDGSVAMPLDPASVAAAIDMLRAEQVESVAICLLHSYANPAHEHAVADAVRAALPERRDLGQQRDPAGDQGVSAHQHDRDQRLCAAGGARLHHRAGRTAARARDRCAVATDAVEWRARLRRIRRRIAPAHIIESGPAAGVVGGAALAGETERAAHHHVRHGRHHREGRPRRERRGAARRKRSRSAAASWPDRACWSARAIC